MTTPNAAHRWLAGGALAAASLLLPCAPTLADQPGESKQGGINMRVGGVRASMPGPSMSPRKGSLLNRPSPILPPSPPRISRPVNVDRPTSTAGNGFAARPTFGSGGLDKPCYNPGRPDDNQTGGIIGGNGTTIDGSTASDRFRLRFHLGAGAHKHPCGHHHHGGHCGYCRPTYYGSWYNNWWYDRPSVVYSGPWYGNDPFVTTGQTAASTALATGAVASQVQPRELTPIELADIYWQEGRLEQSATQFNSYLRTAPDDTEAMRYLAVLMIDQKKIEEAVAMLAMAYQKTPVLASNPLPAAELPGGLNQMRKRVNALSAHANRVKTGSAWLAMAVLVQSEEREDIARMLVERGGAAGLEESVKNEMLSALK